MSYLHLPSLPHHLFIPLLWWYVASTSLLQWSYSWWDHQWSVVNKSTCIFHFFFYLTFKQHSTQLHSLPCTSSFLGSVTTLSWFSSSFTGCPFSTSCLFSEDSNFFMSSTPSLLVLSSAPTANCHLYVEDAQMSVSSGNLSRSLSPSIPQSTRQMHWLEKPELVLNFNRITCWPWPSNGIVEHIFSSQK